MGYFGHEGYMPSRTRYVPHKLLGGTAFIAVSTCWDLNRGPLDPQSVLLLSHSSSTRLLLLFITMSMFVLEVLGHRYRVREACILSGGLSPTPDTMTWHVT